MATSRIQNGKKQWVGRITLPNGKRKSKIFKRKKDALEWETLARNCREDLKRSTLTASYSAVVTGYLKYSEARHSAGNFRDKVRAFRKLSDFVRGDTPITEVSYAQVEECLNRTKVEVSAHRANRDLTHYLACWSWAVTAMQIPSDCPWKIRRFREDEKDKYVPPVEDFWKVYNNEDAQTQRILLAFLHTAARKMEIFNLRWSDVNFKEKTVTLETGKRRGGRRRHKIPMSETLQTALQEQRFLTGFNEFIFINPETKRQYTSAGQMMHRACKRAGVRPFGFHAIRHLSASMLAKSDLPLTSVQAILRHQKITTTAHYIHHLTGVKMDLDSVFGEDQKVETRENAGS